MSRPHERNIRDFNWPQRLRHLPTYLQNYEISYTPMPNVPEDKQASSSEVFRCLRSMREESDQLGWEVQRLTYIIEQSPGQNSQPQVQSKCKGENTSTSPAPSSKPPPSSGHMRPRQAVSAPSVNSAAPPSPQSRCCDHIEDLDHCLQEVGLISKHFSSNIWKFISLLPSQTFGFRHWWV